MKLKTIAVAGGIVLWVLTACATQHTAYRHSILSHKQQRLVDKAIADIAQNNVLPRMEVWGCNLYDITEAQLLNRLLAIEDLDSLARNHPSPAVRTTAGIILIEKAPQAARRLLAERLADTSTLMFRSYGFCIVQRSGNTVGNTLLLYAIDHSFYSRKELESLDSLILTDPAYHHLDRYHRLTSTTIPREEFLKLTSYRPSRAGGLVRPELLTDNRLISDTHSLFYRQVLSLLREQGTPRCYLFDAYMRDTKGYTLVQLYLAEPDRLALLLLDGKYNIVDTMTISHPIRKHALNETDTLHTQCRFLVKKPPVAMRTNEVTIRRKPDQTVDTLSHRGISRSYDIDFTTGRFVFVKEQEQKMK